MKFLSTLAFFIFAALPVGAQSLSLFGIDTTNFPTMKAKFYAFDAAGNQVRPSAESITITENGQPRTIISVSCPPPEPPIPISSVLTVDVSGSMGSGIAGILHIDLAKAAARAWIQGLPAGQSECALSSFDDKNYLNQDFTPDRALLLHALETLTPNGGTDYDMGFLQPLAGSLQVSKRARFKRVIVFLSDGMPNFEPNIPALITEAKQQNCLIFAVTLGMPCPQSLKEITSQTGGQWYENITTLQEAEELYHTILLSFIGAEPCEIVWQSEVTCSAGTTTGEIGWNGKKASAHYPTPLDATAKLQFSPYYIFCKNKLPGIPFDTTLTITAHNANFTVTDIISSNPVFDVNPKHFSLNAGQSQKLMVRYNPIDSAYTWTNFTVQTTVCPQMFSTAGGFIGKKATKRTLKLNAPNGGEVFAIGSDTTVAWEGIPPSESVRLEHSIDTGKTWTLLTNSATGLKYDWKNIPRPPSNQCLIRASQYSEPVIVSNDSVRTLYGHTDDVVGVTWSPDGNRIATGSTDNSVKIWDVATGTLLQTIKTFRAQVTGIVWSPDGSRIAVTTWDTVKIIDATSGVTLRRLSGHSYYYLCVAWSRDGSRIAAGSWDTARVWDATNGTLLQTLKGHKNWVYGIAWSPDDSKIATVGNDNAAKIWDVKTGAVIKTLIDNAPVYCVAWKPDGRLVAVGSTDRTVKVWNITTWEIVLSLTGINASVRSVAWSPDGKYIAASGDDNSAIISNGITGNYLHRFSGHQSSVQSIAWSPDATRIVTGSRDKSAKIWEIFTATSLQSDTSNAVFSIVLPRIQITNIDMGRVPVGNVKDSVVVGVIRNTDSYRFRVDSLVFSGSQQSEFRLVSGLPPFIIQPNDSARVEFRFMPTALGVRQAKFTVFTQSDALQQTIRGEGVQPQLAVVSSVINFGKVLVGTHRDTLKAVTISNVGNAPLFITDTKHSGPNSKDFSTLAGGGAFTLNPKDTVRLDLRFTASEVGRTTGRLQFDYNGIGSPAEIILFAEGFRPDSGKVTLVAGTASAFPGEHTTIPITLELPQNSTLSTVTGFDVTLRYNPTLLFPADNSMTATTSSNDALLSFFAPYNPAGGELLRVPFIATLGDDTATVIKIEKVVPRVSSGKVDVATRDGSFALKGVCYAGGTARLYKPSGRAMLMAIHPNPAEDVAEIEFETSETGVTSLRVFNALGMEVAVPASGDMEAGFHVANVRTTDFGAGTYFIVMTTPTEVHTARFEVVR